MKFRVGVLQPETAFQTCLTGRAGLVLEGNRILGVPVQLDAPTEVRRLHPDILVETADDPRVH